MGRAGSLSSRRWKRTRRAAFDRDGWRCTSCGRPGALEAHHVIPRHKGGAVFDLGNIQTLCRDCHIRLHRPKLGPKAQAWAALVEELL